MGNDPTALVVFQPSGKRGRFAHGTPVLSAARELGVQIESICGGRGICGRCQISVAEGQFAKFGIQSALDHLSPQDAIEDRYASKRHLDQDRRLSCASKIGGDLVIDVPQASIVAGQTIRKDGSTKDMLRNPALRLFYVELDEPDLETPIGDADRLCEAIETQFGIDKLTIPFLQIAQIQKTLMTAKWKVTACIDVSGPVPELVTLFDGYTENLTGIAVDIGSTTIAAHLVDLLSGEILTSAGRANPQIRFGEDLMSRVSYVMMNDNGQQALTDAVRTCICELVDEVIAQSERDRAHLLDAVFVANPVMHHLFLGFDPTALGQAPFNPAISRSVRCNASDLDLNLGPAARVYVLPIVAGHVGADAAAVVLAQKPQLSSTPVLIVDVGTNAEIMLWDGATLFAASSPTGPALEGAEISCGQRAAPGAIERIRIDKNTLAPRFKIIGTEEWSHTADFDPETEITGVCGSGIIEVVGEMLRAGIVSPDGIIRAPENDAEKTRLVADGRTWSYVIQQQNPRLVLSQIDVRAIQLAKGALYAGVRLLMDKAGLDSLNDVRLAGAFGSYIDPQYALLLGLLPDCSADQIQGVGNAAGQGALMALLDVDARREIEEIVLDIVKIETALEPEFQNHFVNAMAMPNAADPFTQTREHFEMDALQPKSQRGRVGRRKRR